MLCVVSCLCLCLFVCLSDCVRLFAFHLQHKPHADVVCGGGCVVGVCVCVCGRARVRRDRSVVCLNTDRNLTRTKRRKSLHDFHLLSRNKNPMRITRRKLARFSFAMQISCGPKVNKNMLDSHFNYEFEQISHMDQNEKLVRFSCSLQLPMTSIIFQGLSLVCHGMHVFRGFVTHTAKVRRSFAQKNSRRKRLPTWKCGTCWPLVGTCSASWTWHINKWDAARSKKGSN